MEQAGERRDKVGDREIIKRQLDKIQCMNSMFDLVTRKDPHLVPCPEPGRHWVQVSYSGDEYKWCYLQQVDDNTGKRYPETEFLVKYPWYVERRRLRFSERYIISHGWNVDLGDMGDIRLPEEILWDEEGGNFIAEVEYSFRGWKFSNCDLYVRPDLPEDWQTEYADDVWSLGWEEWTIEPSEKTIVLERGEKLSLIHI